jgi:hypothetical protein
MISPLTKLQAPSPYISLVIAVKLINISHVRHVAIVTIYGSI